LGRRAPNQSTSGTISTGRRHLRSAVPVKYSELPAIVSIFRPQVQLTLRGTLGAIRSDESLNDRTTIRHDSPPAPLGADSLLDRTPMLHRSEPQREGAFPSLQRYSTECVVSVITKTQLVLSILNNFDLF
jgi:hypothetical protein